MPSARLQVDMVAQPSDTTCGPTCLYAVYRFFEDECHLEDIIREIPALETGGTLAVHLGIHALQRGYRAILYTYNLNIFDPTWFELQSAKFRQKIERQAEIRQDPKAQSAARAYHDFHRLGGQILMRDLNARLLRKYLARSIPIITGLSATFLYRSCREVPETCRDDDERGDPLGHFVVLSGYDRASRTFVVADPYEKNPLTRENYYSVEADRLINAILLGILTYDANLLVLLPPA